MERKVNMEKAADGKTIGNEITTKIRNALSQNIWYHGTVFSNWNSFCQNGIVVDINKETSDALDFGYGFYLAPNRERAEHYITSMMKNTILKYLGNMMTNLQYSYLKTELKIFSEQNSIIMM